MSPLLFESPLNWVARGSCMPKSFWTLLRERSTADVMHQWESLLLKKGTEIYNVNPSYISCHEIFYVRATFNSLKTQPYMDVALSSILTNALSIPLDCPRQLDPSARYGHNLYFFTNFRAIQVYCCHDRSELAVVENLDLTEYKFRVSTKVDWWKGKTYSQITEPLFQNARPLLAWECIFPEGFDMEALSLRDANAHLKSQKNNVPKAKAPAKLTQKEKDHPPPPPPEVREPPSSDRLHGATYQTGKCLGKGGFAICYEGQLAGTKKKYALKIVKSYMPQKKMEQKVLSSSRNQFYRADSIISFKPSFKSIRR